MPTRYHVAVRHPDDGRILVRSDGAMPGFSVNWAPTWPVVEPIVEGLRADPGIEVVVLRAAWLGDTRDDGDSDRLYEAVATDDALPAAHRWLALGELERRSTPMGRAIDGGALEPMTGDRQPWYRAGWFPGMVAWIDERIAGAGIRRRGPVRQVRSWGRSALLTLDTDRGRLWAKQVPGVFAHEVAITGLLADLDPGIVPPLVAADVRGGRILMEHVDGPLLAERPASTEAWLATLARLAEIQRVLAADLDAPRIAGVRTASLADLAARVPGLVAEAGRESDDAPGGLSTTERAALRDATTDLVAACTALDGTPGDGPSVDHGDLSAGQVIVGEMGPVFLDWSDSTITHPFLAAASFLDDAEADQPASLVAAMERAYVDAWGTSSASLRGIDRDQALALARVVHPLHMVSLHVDRVLPGLEQPWELESMVTTHLLAVLPRLATLPRILRR